MIGGMDVSSMRREETSLSFSRRLAWRRSQSARRSLPSPIESLLGLEGRTIPLRIKLGNWNSQSRGQFQYFKICHPADTTFDPGNNPSGNVPSLELANGCELLLGPRAFVSKLHHLASDNIPRGVHAPVQLSGFKLVIVWNSNHLVRDSRQPDLGATKVSNTAQPNLRPNTRHLRIRIETTANHESITRFALLVRRISAIACSRKNHDGMGCGNPSADFEWKADTNGTQTQSH